MDMEYIIIQGKNGGQVKTWCINVNIKVFKIIHKYPSTPPSHKPINAACIFLM